MSLKFGSFSVKSCIHLLFWGGLLVIACFAVQYGLDQAVIREPVTNAQGFTVRVDTTYEIAKGLLYGLPPLLVFGLLWRVLMEPLYHLFRILRAAAEKIN